MIKKNFLEITSIVEASIYYLAVYYGLFDIYLNESLMFFSKLYIYLYIILFVIQIIFLTSDIILNMPLKLFFKIN
jgi:hypothetical protein